MYSVHCTVYINVITKHLDYDLERQHYLNNFKLSLLSMKIGVHSLVNRVAITLFGS